ncbi:MAG: hypothetical protein EP318_08125 [Rhodobacteraceae bacterium]|nr:MAG: hypothetical protein EP318_08125 [Paracoccaceae bacterium]
MNRPVSRQTARLIAGALLVVVMVALALGPLASVVESFDGERISGWVEAAIGLGALTLTPLLVVAVRDWKRHRGPED